MSEHHDEPNPSGSDPATGPTPPRPGPSAGADRFWERYGEARRHGSRNGGDGDGESPEGGGGSTAGAAAEEHVCLEWCPICRGAEVVRATTPPELREQLEGIQRDALALVRAVIDAYLARQGEAAAAAAREPGRGVEDIPID
jgi:hypothetical protein